MHYRRRRPHRGKGGSNRFARRQIRRRAKTSEALRDSMSAIRRGYGYGIPR